MTDAAESTRPLVADTHVELPTKRVTPFELFFDLVFVYGFTQVTALIVSDPTWRGMTHGLLVLAALWWGWIGFAWLSTTTNLEDGLVRIATIAVMCGMLVVGIAVPGAFDDTALAFAVGYAVVRMLFIVVYAAASRDRPALLRNVLLLFPGAFISSTLIVVAASFDGSTAIAIWSVALLSEYVPPFIIDPRGWELHPGHFAERFGLIFIIALGESLIAIGVGVHGQAITAALVVLTSLGVVTVSTLWWTYFDVVAIVGERRLAKATGVEQAALARDSFTYLHLPMVTGVILFAFGVKFALGHPYHRLDIVPAVALLGGIALYLGAHVLFRLRNIKTWNRPRCIVAGALLAALATFATHVHAVWDIGFVAGAMCALIAYESIRYRETRERIRNRPWEHVPIPPRNVQ